MTHAERKIDEAFLDKTQELVSHDLSELDAGKSKGLKLTGLEILGFLAAKVLVPVVCAFVKDVLYQKYKDFKTNKAVTEARQELLQSSGPFKLQVDRDSLVRDVSQSLIAEGVPAALAQKTVEDAVAHVEKELAPPA